MKFRCLFTALAAALHLGAEQRSALPWVGVAFVLYLAVIVMTLVINVPLNDANKAARGQVRSLISPLGASGSAKRSGSVGTSSKH